MRLLTTTADKADDLDAEIFRVCNRLERLAEETGDKKLSAASQTVGSVRHLVRRHMTKKQRESTPV